MALLGKRLAVSIPDTLLEERITPRDKTVKLGLVARACSIYGVDTVEIFGDERWRGEMPLIKKTLEYLETPQYLRRRLFPLDDSLRYAGLLPPLRIPSHMQKVPLEKLSIGEVREGVTNSDGTVDIGLDENPRLKEKVGANKRITIKVTSKNPFVAEVIQRDQVNEYWGYGVESRTAAEVFEDPRYRLKIATSRYGNALQSLGGRLRESVSRASSVKLIFGSPSKGLFDLVGPGLLKRADYVVNLFPEQHVETVRTEEAIFAGLNLVSMLVI